MTINFKHIGLEQDIAILLSLNFLILGEKITLSRKKSVLMHAEGTLKGQATKLNEI